MELIIYSLVSKSADISAEKLLIQGLSKMRMLNRLNILGDRCYIYNNKVNLI